VLTQKRILEPPPAFEEDLEAVPFYLPPAWLLLLRPDLRLKTETPRRLEADGAFPRTRKAEGFPECAL
jgi:hypothetical protein